MVANPDDVCGLTLNDRVTGGWAIVSAIGAADLIATARLAGYVFGVIAKSGPNPRLILDLTDATFIDRTTVLVMEVMRDGVRRHRGQFRVVASDWRTLSALHRSGLDQVFEVAPTLESATSDDASHRDAVARSTEAIRTVQ